MKTYSHLITFPENITSFGKKKSMALNMQYVPALKSHQEKACYFYMHPRAGDNLAVSPWHIMQKVVFRCNSNYFKSIEAYSASW